ncbi:MAG: murein biosynthesis integral membrane protein MurJ [Candidatus Sungbacteria bacterium]|uniref:Probable lipid II flippase MurJ n=1 Tax=Candidatus Sungiibacteriota bacterium TaxID=2750080 RepID=A0A931YD38_9BACT|nr:murein biosynthesis integral membrane protein MurJ [Candidatus Sungbacteria bacterium]
MTFNGFNGFLGQKTKGVLAAAAILAVAGLLSRLLGFGRNALLAYFYGAGDVLDAYFLAFRLPDFFFNLFFFGSFSAGFVPVFIKLKNHDPQKAWKLANDVLNLTLAVFVIFGAVFFVAAPGVLKLIAPGFEGEKLKLAVTLSRIMFLQPIFLGISVVFSGILQSTRRFLAYALAPVFYNLGIIFGILVLAPRLGPAGLAWGVVAGALLHMLIQYPAARHSGFSYKFFFSLKENSIKDIFHIIVPRSLSLILAQLNLVVMAGLASFLGSGRVSVFNFANDLNGLVLGVVAVPLGVAVFPVFSELAAQGKFQEMGETFIKILRRLMFVMMPAAVLFFILRAQIVRLTLGYGRFDWADTVLTIETLGFFLIGLIFQGALAIILRGFFALEDARTPFLVLFFGVLLSLAAALFLAPVMDVSALGLGMAAAAIFNTLVLFFIFKRRVKSVKISGLLKPMSVFALGSVMAGLAAYAALYYLDKFLDTHKVLHLIVQSGSAGVLGVAVYLAVVGLFNMEEVNQILKKIKLGKGVILPSLDEETHQS